MIYILYTLLKTVVKSKKGQEVKWASYFSPFSLTQTNLTAKFKSVWAGYVGEHL